MNIGYQRIHSSLRRGITYLRPALSYFIKIKVYDQYNDIRKVLFDIIKQYDVNTCYKNFYLNHVIIISKIPTFKLKKIIRFGAIRTIFYVNISISLLHV